eukprot:CAMPEP_0171467362 /NCGR_PEP_ID=MMETSP0945-20130129/9914_1 /TAXON_ID=109269 /ORGANISM="Vaucheria litorea, Strain CCMP2940" /LENGTH=122 /DNA_ID=CAMNT_0011995841 /DNA_START=612 /DNA_END=977 /DNA_ORIENTATION=+
MIVIKGFSKKRSLLEQNYFKLPPPLLEQSGDSIEYEKLEGIEVKISDDDNLIGSEIYTEFVELIGTYAETNMDFTKSGDLPVVIDLDKHNQTKENEVFGELGGRSDDICVWGYNFEENDGTC